MDFIKDKLNEAGKAIKMPNTTAQCTTCRKKRALSAIEIAGYAERKATGGGSGIPCKDCKGGIMYVS